MGHAGMAELADAQDSGSCVSDNVQVQALLPAPVFNSLYMRPWRNWQTRTFEGRMVTPSGFKSRWSHQKIDKHLLVDFVFLKIF